ncbi:MAG: hypothetical protein ACN4G0_10785 [Polyangiales bacterium]
MALLVSLVACAPGLLGTWVYDDRSMVENPLFDDFSDVVSVFVRNSADYLGRGKLVDPETTATYRPVTMLTLVGTHAFAPREIAHHAVGWLLHVLTAWLLYLGLSKRDRPGRVDPVAAWLAGLFLLHPIGVEAYVWINGRSDLVAGFFLALLVVLRPGRARLSIALMAAWLLIGFLGTAAKLPFAIAALFLGLGAWLRQGADARRGSHVALAASLTCGIGLFVLLRMRHTPFADHVGATMGMGAAAFWAPAPKVAATAVHALLSLRASAMQSMAWNAIQPWSLAQATAAFALLVSVAGLVWKRDWGGVAYVAGALLTLAPTLFVTQRIWFGFDRYLYMPLILALLAAEPYVRRLVARLASRKGFVRLVAISVLLLAAFNTNMASRAYAGHVEFMQALLDERPEDPTVHVYVTSMLHVMGDRENAAEQLRKIPAPPWPKAVIVPQTRFAADLGNAPLFEKTIAYGKTTYPNDPEVMLETMRWDYQHRRLDDLIESAKSFPQDNAAACVDARDQIREWSKTLEADEQRRLSNAADELRCTGG